MIPEPASWLPVIPCIYVSVPLGKAAQIFSYCTFFLPLYVDVLLPSYCIQDPGFLLRIF